MQQITYEAKEGFNKIFNVIENCEIVSPAYDIGYTLGKFFFKKRDGLLEIHDVGENISGISEYSSPLINENIVLGASHLKKFTLSTTTDINTVSSDTKIFKPDSVLNTCGGVISYSGTATGGANPIGAADAYLEDTSQSWTTNELSGKYLWIKSGDAGGEIRRVKGNTATKIQVDGWTNAAAPSSGSTYSVYEFIVKTPFFSSQINNKTYFYDGNDMKEIPTLGVFKLSCEFDGRVWYVPEDNPNLLYYTEVGQPFINAGFIDTGRNEIIDIEPFGEYILIGKERSISVIKKEFDSSGIGIYNNSNMLSGRGVLSRFGFYNWKGGVYFMGDDKRLYSLSINVVSNKLIPELEDIAVTLGGYIEDFSFSDAFFLGKPQELNVVVRNHIDSTTRIFKFSSKYKGWTVDTINFLITDYSFVHDEYYVSVDNKICTFSSSNGDLTEPFNQRVGVHFGKDNIFALKRIYATKIAFQYNEGDKCNITVNTNGSYTKSSSKKDVDVGALLTNGISSVVGGIGANPFGVDVFGDGVGEIYSSLRIYKIYINRVGNFFQMILEDESTTGFYVGDISLLYTESTPYISPSGMTA